MKTIAFAFALSTTLLASNAQAAAGSVGFDGYITPSTCAVAVNGQGEHGAVTLKPVGWEKLQNAGDFAGDTPFTITLTGCGESGAPAWVRPKFASTGVNPATGNLRNQSGDGNSDIEIQLRNGTAEAETRRSQEAATARERELAEREAQRLRAALAVATGAEAGDIVLDLERRAAVVRVRPTLASDHEAAETARDPTAAVRAAFPDWRIERIGAPPEEDPVQAERAGRE